MDERVGVLCGRGQEGSQLLEVARGGQVDRSKKVCDDAESAHRLLPHGHVGLYGVVGAVLQRLEAKGAW